MSKRLIIKKHTLLMLDAFPPQPNDIATIKGLNNIWPSRLLVPLLATVSDLKSTLFHGICTSHFTSSLKLLFLPGLGVPLSSYLEVALYTFLR